MPLTAVLCLLAWLPLQAGASQEAGIEHITVMEGQDVGLHCAGHHSSALEWKNPGGFVIFFNDQRGLRDQRYQLIHYSKDGLSIRLSKATIHDEGLYSCCHDGVTVQRKKVNVLATPSKLLLEESRIRLHHTREKIVVKCSVWGANPPPRITWLLDNGMELSGGSKHQLENSGGKYNSTSTLTVRAYNQKSTITCVVRHKTLGRGNLTATFHLERTTGSDQILNATEGTSRTPTLSPSSRAATSNTNETLGSDQILNATEGTSATPTPSPSSRAMTLNSNAASGSDKTLNVTEERLSTQTLSLSSKTPTWTTDLTNGSDTILNATEGASHSPTLAPSSTAAMLDSNEANRTDKIFNATERNFSTQTPSPSSEEPTQNSNTTHGMNLTYEEIVERKPSVLFPVLVAVLLFALFIIVILFIAKLWKSHRAWKKENYASELTLESNRSRPNEDNPGQEKNGHTVCWKNSKTYVIRGSCTRPSKNSEASQDSSVFEKQLPYVKETDL